MNFKPEWASVWKLFQALRDPSVPLLARPVQTRHAPVGGFGMAHGHVINFWHLGPQAYPLGVPVFFDTSIIVS